jgi:hypothetical protein
MTSSASNIDGDTDAQRKLLRRQQHDDRVAQRVPGATGKGKQVANVRNGKYLCSSSRHYPTRSLNNQKLYDSNAARTNKNYSHQAAKMTDKQMFISLSVIEKHSTKENSGPMTA